KNLRMCCLYCIMWIVCSPCIAWFMKRFGFPIMKEERRRTKQHDLSLSEIIEETQQAIPTREEMSEIDDEYLNEVVRPLVCLLQKNMDFEELDIFLSGSTAERFCVPMANKTVPDSVLFQECHPLFSDMDYMITPRTLCASFTEDDQRFYVETNKNEPDMRMPYVLIYDNEHVAYLNAKGVKLQIKSSVDSKFRNTKYLNLLKCKHHIEGQSEVTGPAIKIGGGLKFDYKFYVDITFALKCVQWPEHLSDWTLRSKKWPTVEDVERISGYGCHFVPKSSNNKLTQPQTYNWRISFSKAEVELSKLIPENARACFLCIKIILKDYISSIEQYVNGYGLKTILYFSLEKSGPEFWVENDIEVCFKEVIDPYNISLSFFWSNFHFLVKTQI
uniref:Mab-21-like nucleotidyltransferase domain-containing protein n=1 Tax=Clytia hemisphaerica TaxID=252671 RepID=A0A7M6DNU0_9CNID